MEISASTIRAYRERLQVSQRDLAEILGVSQGMISLVELGRTRVTAKLSKALRIKSDEGVLKPTFAEFLAGGGVKEPVSETAFPVIRPIPLQTWSPRLDLRKPPDAGVPGRFYLSGLPADARAFQFVPPPDMLSQDSVTAFKPVNYPDLVSGQIVVLQLKADASQSDLAASVAHLGRVIVTRKKASIRVQFESATAGVPVIDVPEDAIEQVIVCVFRGRSAL